MEEIEYTKGQSKVDSELKDLKESTKPVGDIVKLSKTLDQVQALLTFIDAIPKNVIVYSDAHCCERTWEIGSPGSGDCSCVGT
jgi:tRNA(Met) C34 N-acetyltransferase TmcA